MFFKGGVAVTYGCGVLPQNPQSVAPPAVILPGRYDCCCGMDEKLGVGVGG